MRRVLVTGIGAVTPLANNFSSSWSAITQGVSGIDQISRFDITTLPWKVAGEIKAFNPELYLSQKELRTTDLFTQYALAASVMAFNDSGINMEKTDLTHSQRLSYEAGVIIGSSRGGITIIDRELSRFYKKSLNSRRFSPYLMPSSTVGIASSVVAQKLKIGGRCFGISCACSSGAVAIGEAYRIIKDGYTKIMLAGGAEAPICELCIIGYGSCGALSRIRDQSASRPFSKGRDGFVLSEGAAVLVLEEYEHAVHRNANIYGEIIGYANTTDAYHLTRPDLEGEVRTMKLALKEAKVEPTEITYISAHATSTPLGDLIEAKAIKRVFRDNPEVPVVAIKSMSGHMLAASGAFEIACAIMSIKEGIIPPTINLFEKDPLCDINLNTEMKGVPVEMVLTNSFGFGGINAVLVIKKFVE
ncbi:MAG: beta-ketoacyl-[acyl-carrier-protein] synthase family protein [Thermodesulfovibrionales bacterium]|nr:beta-ketoacyl-[acyl-carrier-protein] synthase family protein [Thermodesulfovibrionales bacterium]